MPLTPPIFVKSDVLHAFNSVAEAEAYLEPESVGPEGRAYDSQGRLLRVRVRSEESQAPASRGQGVELEPAEEAPDHADELHALLRTWLEGVEPAPDLAGAGLPDLVERAWRHTARQAEASSRQATWALTGGLAVLLVLWIWWVVGR